MLPRGCASGRKPHWELPPITGGATEHLTLLSSRPVPRVLLQDLYERLQATQGSRPARPRGKRSGLTMVDNLSQGPPFGLGFLSGLLQGNGAGGPTHSLGPAVRGLYMYGGVGCGKTMLMDLFVESCPPEFKVSPARLDQ